MTVVYIDSLFLLNFVVNYLLLLAAARLSGAVIRRPALAAGAALGGGYAAAVFLPGMGFLLHPLCKLGAAVLMLLCAFGSSRRLLRTGLIFFAVAAAFGGGIFAIELLGGRGLSLKNGIFYSAMDLKLILLSAAGCYVVISLVLRRTGGHSAARRELRPAVVTLGEKKAVLTALVDTGNTLTDPATNRPVMVAEGEKLSGLFPADAVPDPAALADPVSALEHMAAVRSGAAAVCCPTRRWGWRAVCCWRSGWTGSRWGRRTTGAFWWRCRPTACRTAGDTAP